MRLKSRDCKPILRVVPNTLRPIRMNAGALTYLFTEAEAIDLANQLADAVDELHSNERLHHG